ncbi:MAG: hypothetical protein WB510_16215 [Candidatus Sulfotelmatobacter sp.]
MGLYGGSSPARLVRDKARNIRQVAFGNRYKFGRRSWVPYDRWIRSHRDVTV